MLNIIHDVRQSLRIRPVIIHFDRPIPLYPIHFVFQPSTGGFQINEIANVVEACRVRRNLTKSFDDADIIAGPFDTFRVKIPNSQTNRTSPWLALNLRTEYE